MAALRRVWAAARAAVSAYLESDEFDEAEAEYFAVLGLQVT